MRSSEKDETHRPLFVLVVAVLAEQVDGEADAGGGGQVSHGPPLLHLGCCNEKRGGGGLERDSGGERRVACASVFQSALEEIAVVVVCGKKKTQIRPCLTVMIDCLSSFPLVCFFFPLTQRTQRLSVRNDGRTKKGVEGDETNRLDHTRGASARPPPVCCACVIKRCPPSV